jgi:hypothetical protein
VLLDGVAAVVEREVITRSDVERAARVLLVRRGGTAGVSAPVDDGLRAAVLDLLVAEELVVLDGRRRHRWPDTDENAARLAASVRARFASEQEFQAFLRTSQVPESDFLEMMRRGARVEWLVEAEVRLARATPEGRTQDPTDVVAAYVSRLRARTPVRVVARFGALPPGPGVP